MADLIEAMHHYGDTSSILKIVSALDLYLLSLLWPKPTVLHDVVHRISQG